MSLYINGTNYVIIFWFDIEIANCKSQGRKWGQSDFLFLRFSLFDDKRALSRAILMFDFSVERLRMQIRNPLHFHVPPYSFTCSDGFTGSCYPLFSFWWMPPNSLGYFCLISIFDCFMGTEIGTVFYRFNDGFSGSSESTFWHNT